MPTLLIWHGIIQQGANALADSVDWSRAMLSLPHRLANGLDGVRIENKGRMSTLTFFNVSEKDYGNYTCVAINKLGNTNASIILYGRCQYHWNTWNMHILHLCLCWGMKWNNGGGDLVERNSRQRTMLVQQENIQSPFRRGRQTVY